MAPSAKCTLILAFVCSLNPRTCHSWKHSISHFAWDPNRANLQVSFIANCSGISPKRGKNRNRMKAICCSSQLQLRKGSHSICSVDGPRSMMEYNTKIGGRTAAATAPSSPATEDPLHIHADGEDTLRPTSPDGQVLAPNMSVCYGMYVILSISAFAEDM